MKSRLSYIYKNYRQNRMAGLYISRSVLFLIVCINTGMLFSCKKYIEVDAPITSSNTNIVYSEDAQAASVLTGIYARLSNNNASYSGTSLMSTSLFAGMSSDELTLYNLSDPRFQPYYTNNLTSSSSIGHFWNNIYPVIFTTNSAIEGLSASTTLTASVKQQLLGEAKFVRAFCNFYLVNMYGNIPVPTSTDWKVNANLMRSSVPDVYQQIINDLKEARELLSSSFLKADAANAYASGMEERVRPTKWAAAALLARAYLFTGKWAEAESEASFVIDNNSLFSLPPLNYVFKKNSIETIWAIQPVGAGIRQNTGDGATFILPASGPNTFPNSFYLSNELIDSYEPNDQRMTDWIKNVTAANDTTYYYAYKYKIGRTSTPTAEYIMLLRLAEQYLIRAEARAQQNKLEAAADDLDAVRARASLEPTEASDQPALLDAILTERQHELFLEWGHRWFDLKRTNKIDAVMNTIAPLKGTTWNANKALYPIPQEDLISAPNLKQNPGY